MTLMTHKGHFQYKPLEKVSMRLIGKTAFIRHKCHFLKATPKNIAPLSVFKGRGGKKQAGIVLTTPIFEGGLVESDCARKVGYKKSTSKNIKYPLNIQVLSLYFYRGDIIKKLHK